MVNNNENNEFVRVRGELNGSHGEFTGTDGFRLNVEQVAILRTVGIEPDELRPFNHGTIGETDVLYPAYERAWFVAVEEMIRAIPGPLQARGSVTVYEQGYSPVSVPLTSLPISIASGSSPVVSCPDAGLIAGINKQFMNWYVDGTKTLMICHPADFRTVLIAQAGLGFEGFEYIPAEDVEGSVAFLNGANGEWTNKDDVRRRVQVRTRRRQRRRQPRQPRSKEVALSHCAAKYARAIADPFNPAVVGACVPVYPSPPSYKVTAHLRAFTVTIGTAGVGGAWIVPCQFNNRPVIYGTNATFAGTDITMPTTANTQWNDGTLSTLPFADSSGVEGRIISCAARVTYTGTALDLSGMFVSFCEPDHNHVVGASVESLAQLPYAKVENTKRRMGNLTPIFGVKPAETAYNALRWPFTAYPSGSTDPWACFRDHAFAGFVVTGVPGTTFNVELIQHIEYIGRPAAAGLSVSHTDSRGFEMVQQAGSQLASYLASSARAAWPTMRSLLVEAARDVAMSALPASARTLRLTL